MKRFPYAHATHPQWAMAVDLTLAQLRAQMALPDYAHAPSLGLVYITDHYAPYAMPILTRLGTELSSVNDWAGATGVGVCATDAEYIGQPALSVMLCDLPRDQYRVYSGVAPLPSAIRFRSYLGMVHADGRMADLPKWVCELARRVEGEYLFGGITVSRDGDPVQFAWSRSAQGGQALRDDTGEQSAVGGVFSGGLSGVAFGHGVTLVSRVTQGCQPVAPERRITAIEDNTILTLDDRPALDVLLGDLRLDPNPDHLPETIPVLRQTLAGLIRPGECGVRSTGEFSPSVWVRPLVGIDPGRRAVLLSHAVSRGMRLVFCQPSAQAARADLVRICAEIREVLEPQGALAAIGGAGADGEPGGVLGPRILGAHYVACTGRGGAYFGAPGAELRIIRQALGNVPLTGFFTSGQIASRYLHHYTGVLTVFSEGFAVRPWDAPASDT